jgi:hypothetical protein
MENKSAIETVEYVRAKTNESARLSRECGFEILAYLLDVAALEAESLLGIRGHSWVQTGPPDSEPD